jgi:hypothetical protein
MGAASRAKGRGQRAKVWNEVTLLPFALGEVSP